MDWKIILFFIIMAIGLGYWTIHLSLEARISDSMIPESKESKIVRGIIGFLLIGLALYLILSGQEKWIDILPHV